MNATAAAHYPLPDIAGVRDLLGMLFDGLNVKAGVKLDTSPKSGSYYGVYVTDDGTPVALCGCDILFAANSSASLSMLPANAAAQAVKSKELSETMLANLREVMNICTRLLLHDGTPHLKFHELCQYGKLSAAAGAIVTAPKGRVDFEIGISKYGTGVIAVMSL